MISRKASWAYIGLTETFQNRRRVPRLVIFLEHGLRLRYKGRYTVKLVAVRRGLPGMGDFIPIEVAETFVMRGMARFTSDARSKIVFLDTHQKRSAELE